MRTSQAVSATLALRLFERGAAGQLLAQNASIRTQEFFMDRVSLGSASKRTGYFYLLRYDVQFVHSLQLAMRVSDAISTADDANS
jgi:hypothetical protein